MVYFGPLVDALETEGMATALNFSLGRDFVVANTARIQRFLKPGLHDS